MLAGQVMNNIFVKFIALLVYFITIRSYNKSIFVLIMPMA